VHAVPAEFLIGARDGIRVDNEDFRQGAPGRQLFPDGQVARGDGALDLLDDLPKDGNVVSR
jgi:hypothetical protein